MLRYTATDVANNTVCVDISVTVVEQVPDVTLTFAGTLVSDCEVGRKLTLPEPAVSGGSGVKTITAQVVRGSVVVSEEGGTFTPTTARGIPYPLYGARLARFLSILLPA